MLSCMLIFVDYDASYYLDYYFSSSSCRMFKKFTDTLSGTLDTVKSYGSSMVIGQTTQGSKLVVVSQPMLKGFIPNYVVFLV